MGRSPLSGRARQLSLLELLVAIAILSLVLLSFASTLVLSASMDAVARERTAATEAAMSEMDEVLALAWDDMPAKHNEEFDVSLTRDGATLLPPATALTRPGQILVEDLPVTDLRRVTVRVRWHSKINSDLEVALQTHVSVH